MRRAYIDERTWKSLGRRYGEALKEIAIYRAERKETEHTASDYGEAGWSEEEFEEVKESLGKKWS